MPAFIVTEVGSTNRRRIEAANDYYAVAEAASCAVNDVALPIWQGDHGRCYMPFDNSGRQWLVHDAS